MIEGCLCPRRTVVALLASLREARAHVIRIGGALEILQVATHAGSISGCQGVVIVNVALRTLQSNVSPGKRETRGCVVKVRACP